MVAQLDRAQAEGFHRALVTAALDVFADPEGIVEQIEHAADDVPDQSLGTEADGHAHHAGAGDQRADVDAEGGERHHHHHHQQHDEEQVAEDRQQGLHPRLAAPFLALLIARRRGLDDLAVDRRLGELPAEIGHQHDDHGAEQAAQQPCHDRVAGGQRHQVDVPDMGQEQRAPDDEQRLQPALQGDRQHRGQSGRSFGAARRAQQMAHGPTGAADGPGQCDQHRQQPHPPHGRGDPEQPEQQEEDRQQPGDGPPLQERGGRRLGMGRRMAPDHLQPDSQQAQAEDIGYQAPGLEIEAELAQQHDRGIAEGVPPGQDENPPVPEAGGGPVHGQDAESVDILVTRRARCQEESADHQNEAELQEGHEILQQDLAQQRRPVEDQEGADAA